MSIQPLTIHRELIARINQAQESAVRYSSRDDLEYRRILRDCDSLIGIDPESGYIAKGMARIIVGDEGEAEADFKNAIRYSSDGGMSAEYAWCQFLVNLGKYSKALPLFIESSHPRVGMFTERHNIGPVMGATRWLNDMFNEADAMNLNYETSLDRKIISDAASFLAERGVSNERLAAILDLAGDVARTHNMRLAKYRSGLVDLDGDVTYLVKYFVECDPDEAADMAFDLCDRLSEQRDIPADVHVAFEVE